MVSRPAAGGQSRMRLWSTLTGEPIQSLGVYPPNKDKQHAGDNPSATDDLVFSPNGKMLASPAAIMSISGTWPWGGSCRPGDGRAA